ncbi:BQ5605_C007g04509 [Microbotryum silenes-dioicae]|uniref:BQ5605_C007g04509 protein n=1 Tax=Microbotryum silenes-dioicae TaxID=796604 RepID=A0A2X0MUC4_9BASI|nr:BQ5605_C007g04509 [Microbotryum silenes-dioicae]
MGKSDEQVIEEFQKYVNMTPEELEEWLETDESKGSGWTGDDGAGGESVGHDSGRKIVKILRSDPQNPSEDELAHMRKTLADCLSIHAQVCAYCARHLAQEGKMKESKDENELTETKAYRSLKNWGHDMLKA